MKLECKKCRALIAAIGLLAFTMSAWGLERVTALASDARIEVVPYSMNNVVPIHGTTFTTTQITFGQDEMIEDVQNGDLGAWTVSINSDLPYMLFLKPTAYGSDTNMTVVTNEHTYYFHLLSNKRHTKNITQATYAVHFIYPDEAQASLQSAMTHTRQLQALTKAFSNPYAYHWNYSISGDKSIAPLHVFDDGQFTYLQFRPNQPIPAVFAVTSKNGAEAVVNVRQQGAFLIVQQVAPQLTLRLGTQHVASLFNNGLIANLQSNPA